MVRRSLAAGLVLLASTAASGQTTQEAPPEPDASEPAVVADDVSCVAWASFQYDQAKTPEAKIAVSGAVAWFTGLYEGKTGEVIDDALMKRLSDMKLSEVTQLTKPCLDRFLGFATRLQNFGEKKPPEAGDENNANP